MIELKEGRHTLTPEDAKTILAEKSYIRQRPLAAHNVAALIMAMQEEKWLQGLPLIFAELDGQHMLLNGYHRLTAQVEADLTLEWFFVFYRCQSMAEVDVVYSVLDTIQKTRNPRDTAHSTQIGEAFGLGDMEASLVLRAMTPISTGFGYRGGGKAAINTIAARLRSPAVQLEAAQDWWPYAAKFFAAISVAEGVLAARLRAVPIVSVALATVRYQPEKALALWGEIAADDGLRKGTPAHSFHRLLTEIDKGHSRTSRYWSHAAASTWNAHFRGRPMAKIHVAIGKPIWLAGTPFVRPVEEDDNDVTLAETA